MISRLWAYLSMADIKLFRFKMLEHLCTWKKRIRRCVQWSIYGGDMTYSRRSIFSMIIKTSLSAWTDLWAWCSLVLTFPAEVTHKSSFAVYFTCDVAHQRSVVRTQMSVVPPFTRFDHVIYYIISECTVLTEGSHVMHPPSSHNTDKIALAAVLACWPKIAQLYSRPL